MKEQLAATLETSKNYTMQVAEQMPEKEYHFKPAGAGWDFTELLHHIAYGIEWWEDNFVKGNKSDWNPTPTKKNKKEIKVYLEKAYASLATTIDKIKLTDNAVQGFHATLDHITHHRGQAVVYLRCNGIQPPDYTY
jgi:uncharacterized damage-inducible protein DinB